MRIKKYIEEKPKLNESKLALCAGINQPRLNKILNGKIKNIDVKTAVKLCLALTLSLSDSIDLLSRCERAFSPALAVHKIYKELIELYSTRRIDYSNIYMVSTWLAAADNQLIEHGYETITGE